ncbi:transcriptional regulator [Actinacidiphila sp. DG2A-62]|uniref:transcriptional regulator n=1 Tax=Actinacidiphila sp. DG2A-62 TaxID=3108821 RepID=UPI002DBFB735|nr:transcriptional regulator [Actinacidiphila sp. DG2A-62]MEC3992042.1 transcriptional regulator [Actinacidiphila sp. DG2A-62]
MAAVRVPSPRRPGLPVGGAVDALPELFVPEAEQWLSATSSRLACDSYSWMQAVHWVAGSGLYLPRRHHKSGPRSFGPTTVRVAQELAKFLQPRPGIELLMARTGLCKRSVENHLRMLRETGLLVWVFQGTREKGGDRKASEFVLMVPPAFDAALGIRTVQRHEAAPDYTRAVAGIGEAGRASMATLAKKAARKVRKPKKKTLSTSAKASLPAPEQDATEAGNSRQEAVSGADSGDSRCTPMQGGSSTVSTAGSTPDPSEDKLASGQRKSSHPKKAKRGPRKRNKTGQRFSLAGELMRRVPWLRPADKARIAWVVGEVSDAGWSADEVLAALDLRQEPPGGIRRASGFLAARLRGMAAMPGWTTRQQRQMQVDHRNAAVDAARKDRITQVRDRQERNEGTWRAPAAAGVRRMVDAAVDDLRRHELRQHPVLAEIRDDDAPAALSDLEQLSRGEVADLRAAAQANPALITWAVEEAGEAYARRLYSNVLVDQVLNPVRSTLVAPYRPGRTT